MIELKKTSGFTVLARLILCVAVLLSPTLMMAQGASIWGQVLLPTGKPAPFAQVRVCAYTGGGIPCSPLSLLYSDLALTQPVPNPYTADQNGNYSIFAGAGAYILQQSIFPGVVYSYLVTVGGGGASGGSVSSVGLSLPPLLFTVAGSPVTSAGTLTGTLNTQTANTFFGGPCTGSAATPTMRALCATDVAAAGTLSNSTTGQAGTVATISGLLAQGPNATITGAGTITNPYVIGASSGFPFTLGNTSIASGSSTAALAGLTVNGVNLAATGSATLFLNQAGGYSAPGGSGITALTGDGAATGPGSAAFTLANVNSNAGTFGSATQCPTFTVNVKGLITAASQAACAGGGGGGGAAFPATPGIVYNTSTTASRNATASDVSALGGIVSAPGTSQTVTQPTGTLFNLGVTNPPLGSDGQNVGFGVNAGYSTVPGDTGGTSISASSGSRFNTGFYMPGWSWGGVDVNPGTFDWLTMYGIQANLDASASGILNGVGVNASKRSSGDTNLFQGQITNYGAADALGDEGQTPLNLSVVTGGSTYGSVVAGGTGATSITTSGLSNVGTGRKLIDTSVTPITTTQTMGGTLNGGGIQLVNLGTTVTASSCGTLVGGPVLGITGYSVDPYGTVTFTTSTPPAVANQNVTLNGFTTSASRFNGQTFFVAYVTSTTFSILSGYAAQSYTSESGNYFTTSIPTPRQAGLGTIAETFSISLASAYSYGGGTYPLATAAGNFVDTFRLTSVGTYASGTQSFTANLRRPITAGSYICIGGLAGYLEKNTTIGGEWYEAVVGSPSTTSLAVTTLQYGRQVPLTRAGNVSIVPSAQVEASNQPSTTIALGDNNLPLAAGDGLEVPSAMFQAAVPQNNKVLNLAANPYLAYDGVQSNYVGGPLFNPHQLFQGTGVVPDGTLNSLGGTKGALTGMRYRQRIGLVTTLDQPPSDGFRDGNFADGAIVNVDGAFCDANPSVCPTNYNLFQDHFGLNGVKINYTPATHVFNFGIFNGGPSVVIQENGKKLCKADGTDCPAASGLSLSGLTAGTAPANSGTYNFANNIVRSYAAIIASRTSTSGTDLLCSNTDGNSYEWCWGQGQSGTTSNFQLTKLGSNTVIDCSSSTLACNFPYGLQVGGVAVGSSSGTVSSFSAGNLATLFTTNVATPSSTPALSFTLASQSANTFFAAPNGASGAPTFRAIVAADVPTLNQNTTGNAATASAFDHTPTLCATGQAPTGITATGAATGCAAIGGNSTSENVATYSATPTFSATASSNILTLTGNVTSSTLAAGTAGQTECLIFVQDATGGRTVVGPTNVKGFFTVGTNASTRSQQCFTYSASLSLWLAQSAGVVNF